MPIYEYHCRACEHRFEKIISHAQSDKVACDKCQRPAARQLSAFGVGAAKAGGFAGCGTSDCGYSPAAGRCERPSGHVHGPGCGH